MNLRAFTLIEVLTAILAGAILLVLASSSNFTLRQSTVLQDQSMELERNMMFIHDYIHRQLSQSGSLVSGADSVDGNGNDSIKFAYPGLVRCTGNSGNHEELKLNGDQLRCHTAAKTPQPMLDNVGSIQYLYGIDGNDDGSVNIYQNAAGVTDWLKVKSVMTGLLLRSAKAVLPEKTSRSFDILDHSVTVDDRFIYRRHEFVVMLRNRLGDIDKP